MCREELDNYKYQGLVSRALQSIEDKEHLQFPGSSKPDFILFLRFKFGFCGKEALKVYKCLEAVHAVTVDDQNTVIINWEGVLQFTGRILS